MHRFALTWRITNKGWMALEKCVWATQRWYKRWTRRIKRWDWAYAINHEKISLQRDFLILWISIIDAWNWDLAWLLIFRFKTRHVATNPYSLFAYIVVVCNRKDEQFLIHRRLSARCHYCESDVQTFVIFMAIGKIPTSCCILIALSIFSI